jgi:hypothetical protein
MLTIYSVYPFRGSGNEEEDRIVANEYVMQPKRYQRQYPVPKIVYR